jgi:hypothetical protein
VKSNPKQAVHISGPTFADSMVLMSTPILDMLVRNVR